SQRTRCPAWPWVRASAWRSSRGSSRSWSPSVGGTDAPSPDGAPSSHAPDPETASGAPPAAGIPTAAPRTGLVRPAGGSLPAPVTDDRAGPGLPDRDDPRSPPRLRIAVGAGPYGDGLGVRPRRVGDVVRGASGHSLGRLVPHPQADAERHCRARVAELEA